MVVKPGREVKEEGGYMSAVGAMVVAALTRKSFTWLAQKSRREKELRRKLSEEQAASLPYLAPDVQE